jgi:hypothetical protein
MVSLYGEVCMITDGEEVTPWISGQLRNTEGPDSNAFTKESIADGLSVLERDSFQPNAIEQETSKPMFVLPHWHKAYGEALLSVGSLGSPAFVSWAEMEIQTRYLTAFACPIEADESLDLQRATEVLSQLRKAAIVVSRTKCALASLESLV